MKKYILSAALTLALSTSALAGKDNSYDIDFYIGKTSLYSPENFNSKVEGRELYASSDQEVKDGKKIEDQIKTQGTITIPYSWNFFDLNHKIGGQFFFSIGSGFSVGLEISSINPLNFAFEDFTTSKYTASEDKQEFYGEILPYKKNPGHFFPITEVDTLDLLNKEFLRDNESLSKKFTFKSGRTYSTRFLIITEDMFKNLGFNEVKSVAGGEIKKSNGDEIDSKNTEFQQLEAKIRDLGKSLKSQLAHYVWLLPINIKDKQREYDINTETTKAIKTAFISPSIRYNINLNDNFDFNIFAKIGGGFLFITEKSCTTLKSNSKATAANKKHIQELRMEDYTSAVIVKQEGLTFVGGLEASLKYTISDAFSAGINFSANAYGNVSKSVDFIFYKSDDATKTDISLVQLEKAQPEEKDKSWFGLVDATLAVNFTMNL